MDEMDEDDAIDDDPKVISKLLETDEDSDDDDWGEDVNCAVKVKESRSRPRRSTRLASSYGMNDSDRSSPTIEDDHK